MIVVDASVVLELLSPTSAGAHAAERLFQPGEDLHAPALLDVEVLHALRRQVALGSLDADRALEAVEDLRDMPVTRHAHDALIERIWELRHNVTAYDAAYLALGEALGAVVVTRDKALGKVRCRTKVEVFR